MTLYDGTITTIHADPDLSSVFALQAQVPAQDDTLSPVRTVLAWLRREDPFNLSHPDEGTGTRLVILGPDRHIIGDLDVDDPVDAGLAEARSRWGHDTQAREKMVRWLRSARGIQATSIDLTGSTQSDWASGLLLADPNAVADDDAGSILASMAQAWRQYWSGEVYELKVTDPLTSEVLARWDGWYPTAESDSDDKIASDILGEMGVVRDHDPLVPMSSRAVADLRVRLRTGDRGPGDG